MKKNLIKKTVKYTLSGILILVCLLILTFVLLHTTTGKAIFLNKTISIVNKQIHGVLSAEKLTGSLFSGFGFDNFALNVGNKPLLVAKNIQIDYNLFELLAKRVQLNRVRLTDATVFLVHDKSGKWNYELLQMGNDSSSAKDSSAETSDWAIVCDALDIESANINIQADRSAMPLIPKKIANLNLTLHASLIKGELQAELTDFNLETHSPDFKIKSLKSNVNYLDQKKIKSEIKLQTAENSLLSNFSIDDFKNPVIDLLLHAEPISFAEFRALFPELKIYGQPRIGVTASGPLNDLRLKLGVAFDKGNLSASGKLNLRDKPNSYEIQGKIKELNLETITGDTSLGSNLNLNFKLNGKGLALNELAAAFEAKFDASRFGKINISPSSVVLSVLHDSLSAVLSGKAQGAGINANANYALHNNNFQLQTKITGLDLNKFIPDSTLITDLNFSINADGSIKSASEITTRIVLQTLPSKVNGLQLDSSQALLNIVDNQYDLYDLEINSELGQFRGKGEISATHVGGLQFNAAFTDFSGLSNFLPADSIFGAGALTAKISGPLDSLFIESEILLEPAGLATDLTINRLKSSINGYVTKTGFNFKIGSQVDSLIAGHNLIDKTSLTLQATQSKTSFDLKLQTATGLFFETRGIVDHDSLQIAAQFDDILFQYKEHRWEKPDRPALLNIDKTNYKIQGFVLKNGEQALTMTGDISTTVQNQFAFSLQNIDISKYKEFTDDQMDLLGFLNLKINLAGYFASPILTAKIEFEKGSYSNVYFDRFYADLGYAEKKLNWVCDLVKDANDSSLVSSGSLPMHLSFAPFENKIIKSDSVEIKVSTRGLDISFLQPFAPGLTNLGGLLVADVVFSNTLDDLRGIGPIRLINGKINIPELGVKYSKFNILLVIKEKELILKNFHIKSGDGYIKLLEGSLSLTNDGVDEFNARLKAKNFQLANSRQMKGRASGILELGGTIQEPYIYGDMKIDDAEIYYDSFEENTAVTLSSQPFFVVLTDSTNFNTTGALRFQKNRDVEEKLFTDTGFYKNLTGELSFFFPRNVWIKSADANIEINGKVTALKETGDFVLFGNVTTVRGFYDLLGNRFQIDEGQIIFNGEKELNPAMAVKVSTKVIEKTKSNDEEKTTHDIAVNIGGTLLAQEFEFLLNEKVGALEEISSLLVFGKPFTFGQSSNESESPSDEITSSSEENKSNSSLRSQATGLLSGQLVSQLTRRLGKSLNLDVIEIEVGLDDGQERKIKIGKYWTPEVFVSVSQDLGGNNQLVEVEYELPKKLWLFNLFLQASVLKASEERRDPTGLDFILKTDW